MEDHILEVHVQPNHDLTFKCEDCCYIAKDKVSFGVHYKSYHGSKSKKGNISNNPELRQLKSAYSRLNTLYKDTLEEIGKLKAEHKIKVMQSDEEHARLLAENIALKEKNETLYKLGKSYLDMHENHASMDTSAKKVSFQGTADTMDTPNPNVEGIEIVNSGENWSSNNLRGFKLKNQKRNADLSEVNSRETPTVTENNRNSNNSTGSNLLTELVKLNLKDIVITMLTQANATTKPELD